MWEGNVNRTQEGLIESSWKSRTYPDRTIDISIPGVDLGSTLDRLLSPGGIALSIITQLMYILGYTSSSGQGHATIFFMM